MGFSTRDMELLIRLKKDGYFTGGLSVVEIGAQQLSNTILKAPELVEEAGRIFGVSQPFALAKPVESYLIHGHTEHLSTSAPFARDLWKWLGFDYASIDIDGSPGSIALDLNYDDVPRKAKGKYQLVTNYGTTEHVANQLNAFKVIHELAALGGVMIHNIPAQGMINHGLVNYNPKFFWMLARSNGYKWLYMGLDMAGVGYPIPQNIMDMLAASNPDIPAPLRDSRIADGGLVVAMQKVFDTPYVAPIDVQTGTSTDNPSLKRRYWTVFHPDAFAKPWLAAPMDCGGLKARLARLKDLRSKLARRIAVAFRLSQA